MRKEKLTQKCNMISLDYSSFCYLLNCGFLSKQNVRNNLQILKKKNTENLSKKSLEI